MRKIYSQIIVSGVLVLVALAVVFIIFHNRGPQRHITLGAWTQDLFDAKTQKLHPEKLTQFEQMIQKKVSIAHYYIGWEALADPKLIKQFQTLRSNGWEPMLNVNPYYFSQCPASSVPLYKAIAEGKCDKFLHQAGKNLSKVPQPFYLVFAWEMNNPENEWSVVHTGSTSQDFVAAWRHIHTIFQQEKATNVLWVFCPNVPDISETPYTKLYPGSQYVDWIGLDGYNWGTTQSWSQWASFAGVFTSSYNKITHIAPTKPLVIAEVNTTNQGGDKGEWYKDAFAQAIPYEFPKIKAVVIFNEDRKNENVNWKVDISKNSLNSFISAIHTKFY